MLINVDKTLSKDQYLYDPKIRSPLSLGDAIQMLKRRNPMTKIGFTNGTYKVLTPAHCVFLSLCKTHCDLLIVGVNSDHSLRMLKRHSHFSTKERSFALATLTVVDYVTIFDEDTPGLCISSVNPDIIFKGPDYDAKDVVAMGKEVKIIQHPFDIHTSDIIKSPDEGSFFNISDDIKSRLK